MVGYIGKWDRILLGRLGIDRRLVFIILIVRYIFSRRKFYDLRLTEVARLELGSFSSMRQYLGQYLFAIRRIVFDMLLFDRINLEIILNRRHTIINLATRTSFI